MTVVDGVGVTGSRVADAPISVDDDLVVIDSATSPAAPPAETETTRDHRRLIEPTPLGWFAAAATLVAIAIGLILGWVEFSVIGVGCALALVIAVPFVIGSPTLEIERTIAPDKVVVGGHAESRLRVSNPSGTRAGRRIIEDRIGSLQILEDIPALRSGKDIVRSHVLPTNRRAAIAIGPALIARGDPLGLLRRRFRGTEVETLWVHPRHLILGAIQSGFVKDLEGPTLDSSPAGDIAFHALREYSPGDDIRRIHWMSTARVGRLMLRHNVDNRRPHIGVLVDTSPDIGEDHFERLIEVAASLAVSAIRHSQEISVWVGPECIIGQDRPATSDTVLNRLSLIEKRQVGSDLSSTLRQLLARSPSVSAALIVTSGSTAPASLLPAISEAQRTLPVVVARHVGGEQQRRPPLPKTLSIDFEDLDGFALRWRQVTR